MSSIQWNIHILLASKTLFTWSGGPRSSGVGFFCFHALADTKQKKPTPLDRGPPLHINRPLTFCTGKLASVLGVTDLQVGIHTSETDKYYILFFSMITNNQKQKYVSWQMQFSLNLSWLSCIIVKYFVTFSLLHCAWRFTRAYYWP